MIDKYIIKKSNTMEHICLNSKKDIDKINFDEIQSIDLQFSPKDLNFLSPLKNIKFLYLENYKGKDIKGLSNLETAYFINLEKYKGDTIDPLSNLKEVNSIYLNNFKGKTLDALENLTEVYDLLLNKFNGNIFGLRNIKKANLIALLSYKGNNLNGLISLNEINHLFIPKYKGTDILGLRNLKTIQGYFNLDSYKFTDEDLLWTCTLEIGNSPDNYEYEPFLDLLQKYYDVEIIEEDHNEQQNENVLPSNF